ncbi:acyltransferase [Anthocerotibacter panamensis]|uniref:acyltransferase n=1 Tax=Anthocerotibacter panamensis TaxID=2857077 RepID=UPI001C404A8E|nr:acyltransferase [Anthocerotibacter panamensis]
MGNFLNRVYLDGLLYLTNHVIANIPSHTVRLGFYRGILKLELQKGSLIFMGAWFDGTGNLKIGRNSTINQQCRLDNRGAIQIGNNVTIAAGVWIITADHDLNASNFGGRIRPVHIEDYVFVGSRATILPGVTLARGCVVAAGAVVTRDVAPYTIVGGVPARLIGKRRSDLEYNAHYPRLFF